MRSELFKVVNSFSNLCTVNHTPFTCLYFHIRAIYCQVKRRTEKCAPLLTKKKWISEEFRIAAYWQNPYMTHSEKLIYAWRLYWRLTHIFQHFASSLYRLDIMFPCTLQIARPRILYRLTRFCRSQISLWHRALSKWHRRQQKHTAQAHRAVTINMHHSYFNHYDRLWYDMELKWKKKKWKKNRKQNKQTET